MTDSVQVTVSLPRWLHRPLSFAKRALMGTSAASSKTPNLLGDRDIEWSWIAANLPRGRGRALDFGCGSSFLGLAAAEAGYDALGYDRTPVTWAWNHPRLSFQKGDVLNEHFDPESIDLVINCSAIEHVGLAGRYGAESNVDEGDLLAMDRLFDSMKPGGLMLLTIPVGQDAVFEPMTRIYGRERLPRLLEKFDLASEDYWVKNDQNQWVQCDRATAVAFKAYAESSNPLENCYGLGCFKLQKPSAAAPGETDTAC